MIKRLLLLVMVGMLTACNLYEEQPNVSYSKEDINKDSVAGINEFGFELLRALKESNKNIFISPLSISMALAMTVNGAAEETETVMLKAMKQENIPLPELNKSFQALLAMTTFADRKVEVSIANSLWGRKDKDFYDEFISLSNEYYNANLSLLDFQAPSASKTINNWVKKETNGKIDELIPENIDPKTVMYLINALYFNGTWQEPFKKNRTVEKLFLREDGSQQQVMMMVQDGGYDYYENDDIQLIRLPYGEGRMVMDVILPVGTMDSLLNNIAVEDFQNWVSQLQFQNGVIEIPRFSLDYETSLIGALSKLGMEIAFDENKANFSKIAPIPPNLYISEVLHKTFLEVNEEGTEAAAATSVEIREESAMMYDFHMEVNRPFLYIIHDLEIEAIVFIGITENIN